MELPGRHSMTYQAACKLVVKCAPGLQLLRAAGGRLVLSLSHFCSCKLPTAHTHVLASNPIKPSSYTSSCALVASLLWSVFCSPSVVSKCLFTSSPLSQDTNLSSRQFSFLLGLIYCEPYVRSVWRRANCPVAANA